MLDVDTISIEDNQNEMESPAFHTKFTTILSDSKYFESILNNNKFIMFSSRLSTNNAFYFIVKRPN